MRTRRTHAAVFAGLMLCALPVVAYSQAKGKAAGAGEKEQPAAGRAQTGKQATGKTYGAQAPERKSQPQQKARGNERARSNEPAPQQAQGRNAAPRGKAVGTASEPPGIAIARARGGEARALGVETRKSDGVVALPRTVAAIANSRGPFVHAIVLDDVPVPIRAYVLSDRPQERVVGKTIALALARGLAPGVLAVQPLGNGVVIVNQSGVALLALDESSAANLGGWKVATLSDRIKSGAPSFCRSGEGHPVWGRQWCIDKGFGLGTTNGVRWARTGLSDVVFSQPTTTELITATVLRQVLGPTAFDRLAAHAITLGLADPLTASWLGQTTDGPRVLYVHSETYPVAELVDVNRDGRPETMFVALRPW